MRNEYSEMDSDLSMMFADEYENWIKAVEEDMKEKYFVFFSDELVTIPYAIFDNKGDAVDYSNNVLGGYGVVRVANWSNGRLPTLNGTKPLER